MKNKIHYVISGFALLLATTAISFTNLSGSGKSPDYIKAWKKADSLKTAGQPRAAVAIAEKILSQAISEKNEAQWLKAHLFRLGMWSLYEEDYEVKAIEATEKLASGADGPGQQVLQSILAGLYASYLNLNEWKIRERGRLAGETNRDFREWDATRLSDTIAALYQASLSNTALLGETGVRDYEPILDTAEKSNQRRPSLLDFLAYRALEWFTSEQGLADKSSGAFQVDNPDFFSPVSEFLRIRLDRTTSMGNKKTALQIYQLVLMYHHEKKNLPALIHSDLNRLEFVYQNATLRDKDSLYVNALFSMAKAYALSPFSTDLSFALAQYYERQSQPLKAANICNEAIRSHPDSEGASNCIALLERLKQPSLMITAENMVLPAKPVLLSVSYKNLSKLYGRVYTLSYRHEEVWNRTNQDERLEKLLIQKPVSVFELPLDDLGDLAMHTTETALPGLPAGRYAVVLSSGENFIREQDDTGLLTFQVTALNAATQDKGKGLNALLVVDRESGNPLNGVEVKLFGRRYDAASRNWKNIEIISAVTNPAGFFEFAVPQRQSTGNNYYQIVSKGDTLIYGNLYLNAYTPREPYLVTRTHLFTDRMIYRPGQTVYYKGIMISTREKRNHLMTSQACKIQLLDANSREVGLNQHTTNAFGSFSGSFVLPSEGLAGNFTLATPHGSLNFSVEEYKRPTFGVTFDLPATAYRLGEEVSVQGQARAYAGYPITGAGVRYRVVRQARYPFPWFRGGYFPWKSDETEIESGTAVCDGNGHFTVRFKAAPDPTITPDARPYFSFRVTADVVDASGETRSGQTSLSVGYQALLLNVALPEKLDRMHQGGFRFKTTNLSGQPEPANVKLQIYRLIQPDGVYLPRPWSFPDHPQMEEEAFKTAFPGLPYRNENEFANWKKGSLVFDRNFVTPTDSILIISDLPKWEPGVYQVELSAPDRFGEIAKGGQFFILYDASAKALPYRTPDWFVPLKVSCEPGEKAAILIGSCEKDVRVLMQVVLPDSLIREEWLIISNSQQKVEIPVIESYRGNFAVNFLFFKNNRTYNRQQTIEVPHTPRKLKIELQTFRSVLNPGQEETWTISAKDHQNRGVKAELLAAMYDASLDAFRQNHWSFSLYPPNYGFRTWNVLSQGWGYSSQFSPERPLPGYIFRTFDQLNWFGYPAGNDMYIRTRFSRSNYAATAMKAAGQVTADAMDETEEGLNSKISFVSESEQEGKTDEAVNVGEIRSDFRETAFFVPKLQILPDSGVSLNFKVPDALTKWRLQLLAHTADLKTGYLTEEVFTRKSLMVMPNAPRFLRTGDTLVFPARIVNLTDADMTAKVSLRFTDPTTGNEIPLAATDESTTKTLTIKAGGNEPAEWKLAVSCQPGVVVYRITAVSQAHTDAMEDILPVLTNRVWVTDTYPLFIAAESEKDFSPQFNPRGLSDPYARITFEFTGNPAWYAVQAMPQITRPAWESADALFRAYYAHTLSAKIIAENPNIRNVFQAWRQFTPSALQSNLSKNQDLKSVVLSETPWVQESASEEDQKKNLATYFYEGEIGRLQAEHFAKLKKLQLSNGGFSWFAGMPDSRFTTQEILTGMGRLVKREALQPDKQAEVNEMIRLALPYLDAQMQDDYHKIREWQKKDKKYRPALSALTIQYLYMRSYLTAAYPVEARYNEALNYFYELAVEQWTQTGYALQGMLAVAFFESGRKEAAEKIIQSFKDRAIQSSEKGIYWARNRSHWWYDSQIETQAVLIEAFMLSGESPEWAEGMKQWLLVQKRTQHWENPRATAEAVYALLLTGKPLLRENRPLDIHVGNRPLLPGSGPVQAAEAGSGYFRTTWPQSLFSEDMGSITVKNPNRNIAWGGIYLQYFDEIDKVEATEGGLQIQKEIFVERNTPQGPELRRPGKDETLNTGDNIVVRLTILSDLDLEYVHLKDYRATGLEPVDVISGYRWQDGAGYYLTTRDVATHFFFGYLPRGKRVLEYKLRVFQKGSYSSGFATLQCLYAPEFSARSGSVSIRVL